MGTTIYLIRHGQTEWNVERRMQGRLDSPLTEKGVAMTRRLAAELPPVDAVYASPLGRTLRTARLLFGGRAARRDDRLREIHLGAWEGRLQVDLDVEDPERHAHFWKNPDRFVCPDGENFYDVSRRSADCLEELAARHAGEAIALVSHTTIIRSMLFHVEKRAMSDFWKPPAVYPASVSELRAQGGALEVVRVGDITHYDAADIPSGAY